MTGAGRPGSADTDLEARLRAAFEETHKAELPARFFDGWPAVLPARRRFGIRGPLPILASTAIAASLVLLTGWIVLRPAMAPVAVGPSPSAPAAATPGPSPSAGSTLPAGVIAWVAATPAPSASPSEPSIGGLSPCSTDTLDVRFSGWNGGGGSLQGGVVMSVPGSASPRCTLAGVPSVSVLDESGRTMDIDNRVIAVPTIVPVVMEPGLALPPEHESLLVGQAGFSFFWSNWCGQDPGSKGALVLDLPDSGTRRLAIDLDTPTCISPAERSGLSVWPIEAAEAPEPSPPPWSDLPASVSVPSVAVAGETLQFFVTVHNTSGQPVPLDPCPAYVERLSSGTTTLVEQRYRLNCEAAPIVETSGSLTFEMLLPIPADARSGPGLLFWAGDGPYGLGGAKLPITIAAPGTAVGSVPPATLPPSQEQLDRAEASRIAAAFETARAGGDWQEAWQLLSPFSQQRFGTVDGFVRAEAADNTAGATTFVIADPTHHGDLLDPAFLGDELFFDLKGNALLEHAWVVAVRHPNVSGASAGSENLVLAPLVDGTWRVWVR